MWQADAQAGMSMPKGHDYCTALALGDHDDWRLPTIKELQTTASFRNTHPAVDTRYFRGTPPGPSGLWAGPRIPDSVDSGWHVGYPDGHVMAYSAHANKFIRCVRADNNAMYLYSDFIDNGDRTVTDKVTDLDWQKTPDATQRTWSPAIKHCESLTLAEKSDWRLPNMTELVSLVDYTAFDPSIDSKLFPDTQVDLYYWTSTSDVYPGAKNMIPTLLQNGLRNEEMEQGTKIENHVAWGISF